MLKITLNKQYLYTQGRTTEINYLFYYKGQRIANLLHIVHFQLIKFIKVRKFHQRQKFS